MYYSPTQTLIVICLYRFEKKNRQWPWYIIRFKKILPWNLPFFKTIYDSFVAVDRKLDSYYIIVWQLHIHPILIFIYHISRKNLRLHRHQFHQSNQLATDICIYSHCNDLILSHDLSAYSQNDYRNLAES